MNNDKQKNICPSASASEIAVTEFEEEAFQDLSWRMTHLDGTPIPPQSLDGIQHYTTLNFQAHSNSKSSRRP